MVNPEIRLVTHFNGVPPIQWVVAMYGEPVLHLLFQVCMKAQKRTLI